MNGGNVRVPQNAGMTLAAPDAEGWFNRRGWAPFDFQREVWAAMAAGQAEVAASPVQAPARVIHGFVAALADLVGGEGLLEVVQHGSWTSGARCAE